MADDRTISNRQRIEELIFIQIPHVASGILFLIAVGINIVNVIGRYVFSMPVFWAEEVLTFIVIWAVFLIAGTVTYRGAHLNMDLLYNGFSAFWQRVVNVVITICLIGSTLFVGTQSWKVIVLHYQNGGLVIEADGATTVPGIWAAGEITGGVHGRNRMMGNSLLDICVFGRRAGAAAARTVG